MSYKGDQDILPYCVRALLSVFKDNDIKIYVMDDSNNPMADYKVNELTQISDKISYEKTTFERNRNLNGKPCCIGMVEKFIEHAEEGSLNLKVDPDTIICHRRVFDEFYNNPNTAYGSCSRPGCYFSGVCYMFRTEILEKTLELIKEFPIPEDRGPEDFSIGVAMCAASLPKLAVLMAGWNQKAEEGVVTGWNYLCPNDNDHISMYYKIFQFVSMGNWFMYKGLTPFDRIQPAKMLCEMVEKTPDLPGKTCMMNNIWL